MGYDWLSEDHARAFDAHLLWREHDEMRKQRNAERS